MASPEVALPGRAPQSSGVQVAGRRRKAPYTLGVEVVSDDLVHDAARRLGEAARKPARVILFGSYARGQADPGSDLDFLVVQQNGFNRRREIVRLQAALSPLRLPAEVLVIDHEQAAQPDRAGDAVREALRAGVVLYESA
jgi:predicted nucleotidyltransferase